MSNPLSINIPVSIDKKKTITEINTQISSLSKNIKSLNINVDISGSQVNQIKKQITDLQNQLKNSKVAINPIDTSQTQKDLKQVASVAKTTMNDLKKDLQSANPKSNIKLSTLFDVDGADKKIKSVTATVDDLQGHIQKLKYELDTSKVVDGSGDFGLKQVSSSMIDNTQKMQDSIAKAKNSIINNLAEIGRQGKLSVKQISQLLNSVNGAKIVNELNKVKQSMTSMSTEAKQQSDSIKSQDELWNKIAQSQRNAAEETAKWDKAQQQAVEKTKQQTATLEQQLATYKRMAQVNVTNLMSRNMMNPSAIDHTAVDNYLKSVKNLNAETPNLKNKMQDLSTSFKEIQANAQAAGGRMITFGGTLKQAAQGMLLWGVAGTAIYGTLHALQDTVKTIIDVDTAMTNLKRVMNSDTDFNGMLQQTISLSIKLGRNLDDLLQSETAFAGMGYDEKQVLQLTKVEGILQNISDLNPQDATNALISGMTNFGISAKNSLDIVTSLNSVDNNYAVTTQQLAQSLTRSASTAKEYGVSLSELLGMTTAVNQATRESGTVIGNFLKSEFSQLSSPKAVSALTSIGVAVKDQNGQMRSAWSILQDTSKRFQSLNQEQRNFVSLSLAGRYQLSRFNALMQNFGIAQSSAATASEKNNSAIIENSKYLNSMQARLNILNTQWKALQLQMGKAVISDSLVESVSILTKLASVATTVVKYTGLLPIVFGGVSTALILMSKNFRDAAVKEVSFASVTKGLAISMDTLKFSMRGLLVASGVGAVFAGLGFIIEKLMDATAKYNEQQSKIQSEVNKSTSAYKSHGQEIDSLVSKYEKLSAKSSSSGLSSSENKEYLSVQNQLNKLLPSVTDHVDKNQQAHLRSADAVKQEVSQLRDLTNAKTDKFLANFSSQMDNANKKVKSTSEALKQLKEDSQINADQVGGTNTVTGWKAATPTSDPNSVENISKQIVAERDYQSALSHRQDLMKQFASAYASQIGAQNRLTQSDQNYISGIVEQNKNDLKTADGQKKLENQIKSTTASFDMFRHVFGSKIPTLDLEVLMNDMKGINLSAKDSNSFQSYIKQFQNGSLSAKDLTSKLESMGISSKKASTLIFDLSQAHKDAAKSAKTQQQSLVDLIGALDDADKYATLLQKTLTGTTTDSDAITRATNAYLLLSDAAKMAGGASKLNADQQQVLSQSYEKLAAEFPQFVEGHKLNINAIIAENKANGILEQAYQKAASGQLNADQSKTLAAAAGAKARIAGYEKEIEALDYFAQAFNEVVNNLETNQDNMTEDQQIQQMKVAKRLKQNSDAIKDTSKYKNLQKAIKSLESGYTGMTNSLEKSFNASSKSSNSTKKSTESITKYKYNADKLASSLDSVNSRLQILTDQTTRYDQASSKYRSNISKEISLLKQKNDILKAQAKSLAAQIKAGKIIQYGELSSTSTKTTTSVSGGSSSSSKSVSGGSTPSSWTSAIKSAATAMGVSLSKSALSTIIKRINQESSGSQTVVNTWDSNAKAGHPSKGLLQYIDSTFKKYAVKGHTNINSGYDQLLAMFNNTNWLRDISRSGGWGPTGSKRTSSASGKVSSSGSSSSSSSSTSKTVGKTKADKQAAVAQAKQQLNDLKQQIVENENAIQQAYLDLVNSHITAYDNRLKTYDASISKYASKAESANVASKAYRSDVTKEISISKSKQKEQVKEINYIEKQIKTNKHLTSAQKADLKSQLADKKSDLEATKAAIKQFYADIVNSNITHMENISNTIDVSISKYQQMADVAKQGSTEQINALNAEEAATNKKLANQQKELAYIDKQWKSNKNLTAAQKRELRTQSEQLKSTIASTVESLQQLNLDIVNGQVAGYENKAKAIDAVLARYQYEASAVDQTSKAYVDAINREIDATKQKQSIQQQELDYINQQIAANNNLTSAQKQQLQEQADDLQSAIYQSMSSVKDFADSIKQVYQTIADNVVDTIKDAYQKQIDAAQKAHDKKVDLLDDEQKKFDDNIKKQQDAIDKQASDDSYADELAKDQKAVTDLQTQIANFAMDNSIQGKAKTADLKSQLADAQSALDQFQKDHAVDVRKQALDDQQTAFDANIDTQKTAADDQMTAYEDQINSILDSDRKWTGIQQDILNGHYGDVLKDFQNFSNVFQQESSLLGQSITDNLLDKIRDLSNQIQGLGLSGNGTNTSGYSTQGVQLPAFADGGYTGHWSGGKGMLSLLHSDELVFNSDQQKSLMDYIRNAGKVAVSSVIGTLASQVKIPTIPATTSSTSTTDSSISLDIHDNYFQGTTEQQANQMFGIINNKLNQRGIRTT